MSSRRLHHRHQPCSVWVDHQRCAKPRVAEWLEDRTLLSANAVSELIGNFTIQLTAIEPTDSADGFAGLAEPTEISALGTPETVSTVLLLDLSQLVNRTEADTESLEAAFGNGSTFEFTGELHFESEFAKAASLSWPDLLAIAEASLPTESNDSANNEATNYSVQVTGIGRIVPASFRSDDGGGDLHGDKFSTSQLEITLTAFVVRTHSLPDSGEAGAGNDQLRVVSGFDPSDPQGLTGGIAGDSPLFAASMNSELTQSDSANLPSNDAPFVFGRPSSDETTRTQSGDATSSETQPQRDSERFDEVALSDSGNAADGKEVGAEHRQLASFLRFTSSSTYRGPLPDSGNSPTPSIAARSERSLTEVSASVAAAIEVTQQFDGNWIEPLQPIIGMTGSLLLAVQSLGKSVLLSVFGASGSGDGPIASFVEPILEQADLHLFEAPDRWELKTVEPHYEAAFTQLAQADRHFEIRNIDPVGDDVTVEVLIPSSFLIVSPPQHGLLESVGSRSMRFQYQPDPGFSGVDSFRYRATAADGTSQDGIIVLTVKPGSQETQLRTASLADDAEFEFEVAAMDAEPVANRFDDVVDSFQSFEDWRGDLD